MKEYYINRTDSLHECHGEVHIVFKDEWENKSYCLIWNASELLKDIPSLYELAKRAKEAEDAHEENRYRDFAEKIKEDFKRPVGRPPKE